MRLLITCACLGAVVLMACDDTTEPPYEITVNPADFVAQIDNPYLPLTAGKVFRLEGESADGHETNIITVAPQTYSILGVACTVVEDTVLVNGALIEATTDWFAQDLNGTVWYFGEASRAYENGVLVSTEGSWQAGQRGAMPGIVMPGDPAPGAPYRQEYEKGVAEDRAQVISRDESVTVPYGSFVGCVRIEEWTDLEPGIVEYKNYAKNVGMVSAVSVVGESDVSKLVSITTR
jgi:hypothetical protein